LIIFLVRRPAGAVQGVVADAIRGASIVAKAR
jgi:hypothetical protein